MSFEQSRETVALLRQRMQYDVMGRDDVIDLIITALLADGHVLLEDYPGSGKTTLAKALGRSIASCKDDTMSPFRRMQFTPDLLPGDITGVMVFDPEANVFEFRPGPIFAHVALVDEINRTSPKVQSALLESMGEKQVTVDNITHSLSDLFFVIATQNPLDQVGTYPLPVAQLDRFMFKIRMTDISRQAELDVVKSWGRPRQPVSLPQVGVDDILRARQDVRESIAVADAIMECLVDIIRAIREDSRCLQAFPRPGRARPPGPCPHAGPVLCRPLRYRGTRRPPLCAPPPARAGFGKSRDRRHRKYGQAVARAVVKNPPLTKGFFGGEARCLCPFWG